MPVVFFAFAHVETMLRDKLKTQPSMLKKQRVIDTWHDRRVGV